MPAKKSATSLIQAPWQGLFLNMPSQAKDPHAFDDCLNVRIEEGKVRSDLLGEGVLASASNNPQITDRPGQLIYTFIQSTGNNLLVLGDDGDLYNGELSAVAGPISTTYITPVYVVGTASAASGASATVTGTGTLWASPLGGRFYAQTSVAVPFDPTSPGSTITLNSLPSGTAKGQLIGDNTNTASIQPGTMIENIVGTAITLSAPLIGPIGLDDQIVIGNFHPRMRNNARIGDQIHFGSATANSPTATWYSITAVNSDASLTINSTSSFAGASSGAYTLRQRFTQQDTTPVSPFAPFRWNWSVETFPQAGAPFNSDVMIAVNGYDPTFAWDGVANSGTYRLEVPFIATQVRAFRNLMIYGGLLGENGVTLPNSIANSDNGVPTTMAGGVAGQYVVSDTPGPVIHLGVLGATLMIYLGGTVTGSVISASFVGFPTNFAFSVVINGRGPVAPRLVAEFPDRHQFLSMDGMYRYNGLFIQVMNDHIWRDFMNPNPDSALAQSFDYSRAALAYTALHPGHGELQWVVPSICDVNLDTPQWAYVEHYMEQPNSYLFKPYTRRWFPYRHAGLYLATGNWLWNQFTGTWDQMDVPWNTQTILTPYVLELAQPGSGDYYSTWPNGLYTLFTSNTQGTTGQLSPAYVLFPMRPVNDGLESRGLVKRVYPVVEYPAVTETCFVPPYAPAPGTPPLISGVVVPFEVAPGVVFPFEGFGG